jgi:hypothetical protein
MASILTRRFLWLCAMSLAVHVSSLPGSTSPVLQLIRVPPYGSLGTPLQGRVLNGDAAAFRVAVFIHIPGQGWWIKPLCLDPAFNTIPIQPNGNWSASITTGGVDETAVQIAAYLVPATYSQACVLGTGSLPETLELAAVAKATATRTNPAARKISFSGYEWSVRSSRVPAGPDGNYFSDASDNVTVDSQGRLHLRLTNRNGRWYGAEIVAIGALGYGTYRFYVETSLADLDANAVLGLFTYSEDAAYSHREIDIEFSKWGRSSDPNNAQFVVQPFSDPQNIVRFQLPAPLARSVHSFDWQRSRILFESVQGLNPTISAASPLIQRWNYARAETVPTPGDARPRLNLWLVGGRPPLEGRDVEVVISRFEHVPGASEPKALYFPRYVNNGSVTDIFSQTAEDTGLAIVNLSDTAATLRVTAMDMAGVPLAGVGRSNPVAASLKPGEQKALLTREIFGSDFDVRGSQGWLKLESTVSQISALTLMFNPALSFLDGASFISTPFTAFVLAAGRSNGPGRMHIANPNMEPASVGFNLVDAGGSIRASTQRIIGPNAAIIENIQTAFGGVGTADGDYVKAVSDRGVAALQTWSSGNDVSALLAQGTADGSKILYAPQFASTSLNWQSELTLVNLEPEISDVDLTLFSDDGRQIAARNRNIPPDGKLLVNESFFFGDRVDTFATGYIVVNSTRNLTGFVGFADSEHRKFSAVAPLSPSSENLIFPSVVSNETYFTGLAVLNPWTGAARVSVKLLDRNGVVIRSITAPLGGKERRAWLLTEYFPDLEAIGTTTGYLVISSDKAVNGLGVIGTRNQSAVVAIPGLALP